MKLTPGRVIQILLLNKVGQKFEQNIELSGKNVFVF